VKTTEIIYSVHEQYTTDSSWIYTSVWRYQIISTHAVKYSPHNFLFCHYSL